MAKVRQSVVVGGLSGRVGNAVFVATPGGTVLRDRPFVSDPQTPAQVAARERVRLLARVFRSLDLAEAQAWRAAAQGLGLSAQQYFNRLGVRFLAANPAGTVPRMPPAFLFPGDAVRFVVSAGPGGVVVTADRANAPGVVTEILIQKLPSVHCRTYLSRYRNAGFVAFGAGETKTLPQRPGVFAVATRFVYAPTGQSTELIEWGLVEVG